MTDCPRAQWKERGRSLLVLLLPRKRRLSTLQTTRRHSCTWRSRFHDSRGVVEWWRSPLHLIWMASPRAAWRSVSPMTSKNMLKVLIRRATGSHNRPHSETEQLFKRLYKGKWLSFFFLLFKVIERDVIVKLVRKYSNEKHFEFGNEFTRLAIAFPRNCEGRTAWASLCCSCLIMLYDNIEWRKGHLRRVQVNCQKSK